MTCMSAIVCFNITARTAVSLDREIGEPAKKKKRNPACFSILTLFPKPSVFHKRRKVFKIFYRLESIKVKNWTKLHNLFF